MHEIIKLEGVSKKYIINDNEFYALRNINLSINEGELVMILGPSGAGKSTLLNLIAGMDNVSEGHLFFNDDDISEYNDAKLTNYRAKNIGFIFQFYNLIPSLTAYENVALIASLTKDMLNPKEIMAKLGLKQQQSLFPQQLSGGEQQRTSIARAIVNNSKLLLCDEPTGALDTKTGNEVIKILQDLCFKEYKTIIIVTHNEEFSKYANKIIKIVDGTINDIVINKDVHYVE